MGVSINWLKEYVDYNWTPEELAHRLTMAGIAIEGVEKAGDDSLLELDLTPNRGDCLGMINLAREVAALNGSQITLPAIELRENGEDIREYITVEIADPDLCPRYTARLIKNIKVKTSPQWLQDRLLSCGIRPINNIVDVTNYVMMESNQPLHAFDYDLLSAAKKIVVRPAQAGEKITTLDDVERELDANMLLITDNGRPVAVAGTMGGQNTEINDNTVNVLLESANFKATSIRKTSRKLGLRSDSSIRFEKGSDVNGVVYAANRAAALMQELGEGELVGGIWDCYPEPQPPQQIILRPERVNYLLGTSISPKEIREYIDKLRFAWQDQDGDLLVTVPTYRPDIEMEVDLIEEVARLYGYDRIPATLASGDTTQGGLSNYQKFTDNVRQLMAATCLEVINYSFISPRVFDMLLLPENSELRNPLRLANPLSEEQSVMRTLLLPGILDTVSRNMARKNSNMAFFEIGAVFYPQGEGLPVESLKMAAVLAGKVETNWLQKEIDMDFYYLKGLLQNLLDKMGIDKVSWQEADDPSYHPGRSALIKIDDQILGIMGEIHPLVRQNFDIKQRVCACELDMDTLFNLSRQHVMMDKITRYPAVERDLAVVLNKEVKADRVLGLIQDLGGELLQNTVVFDVYSGEQVPEGCKSMAFRLTFQSAERTLTEAEVNTIMDQIRAGLQTKLQASRR